MSPVVAASSRQPAALSSGAIACGSTVWRMAAVLRATLFVKATFALVHDAPARLVEPAPLVRRDRHRDRDPSKSLGEANETAPYLPCAGVILYGHACAPKGRTVTSAAARLAVYREQRALIDKTLHVYGDRTIDAASSPRAFERMPLLYERAFGGPGNDDNPVGIGASPGARQLPNIVDPADPHRPAGFGPIASYWPNRRKLLGRAEPSRLDSIALDVPEGFDWRHFHAAPADQQIELLSGDEWIVLDGMSPTLPRVVSRLPAVRAQARVYHPGGASAAAPCPVDLYADLLVIDADRMLASVVWRGHLAIEAIAGISRLRALAGVEMPGLPIAWPDPGDVRPPGEDVEVPAAPDSRLRGPSGEAGAGGAAGASGVGGVGRVRDASGQSFTGAFRLGEPEAGASRVIAPSEPSLTGTFRLDEGEERAAALLPFTPAVAAGAPASASSPPGGAPRSAPGSSVPSGLAGSSQTLFGLPFAASTPPAIAPVPPPVRRGALEPQGASDEATRMLSVDEIRAGALSPIAPFSVSPPGSRVPDSSSLAIPGAPWSAAPAPPPAVMAQPNEEQTSRHAVAPPRSIDASATAVPVPVALGSPSVVPPALVPPALAAAPTAASPVLVAPSAVATWPAAAAAGEPTAPTAPPAPATAPPAPAAALSAASAAAPPPVATGARALVLEKLSAGEAFYDLDLAGADLHDLDFTGRALGGCNLRGANLARCTLTDARMSGARLAGADLTGARLENADLSRADLSRAVLSLARFDRANLADADLSSAQGQGASFDDARAAGATFARGTWDGATFRGLAAPRVDFAGASLGGASFEGASIDEVRLDDARGTGSSFAKASLTSARAQGASLTKTTFVEADARGSVWEKATLEGSTFDGAKLAGANFARAVLSGASFAGADLARANLQHAIGDGASMRRADLQAADLRQARMHDACFDDAKLEKILGNKADLSRSTFVRANLAGASLRPAKLKQAKLAHAILTGADLRDADLEGGNLHGADRTAAKLNGANLKGVVEDEP